MLKRKNEIICQCEECREARRKGREELQKRLDSMGVSRIIKNNSAQNRYTQKTIGRARNWILEQLGNKCQKCGEDNPIVFDIHREKGHKEKRTKEWIKWFKEKKIPDDVRLFCANCHRIRTDELRSERFIGKHVTRL